MSSLPFIAWIQRPVAVLSWAVALVVAGIWAFRQIPLEWTPQIELPAFTVSASWPGVSSRTVERYVTAPLERAVQRVPGTAQIESISSEGESILRIQIRRDMDPALYAVQLGEALERARTLLPERVIPVVDRQIPEALRDEVGFMTLQLVGPMAPTLLRRLAEERLVPAFQSLEGIGNVTVYGGRQQELLIRLRLDRIRAHGLSMALVERRLAEQLHNRAFGHLMQRGERPLLLHPAMERLRDLRQMPLAFNSTLLTLQDVADLIIQPAPVRSISRINGQPVITLRLDRAPGSHLLEVARAVHARVAQLQARLPAGAQLRVADDRSENIRAELRDLLYRGGVGLLLLTLVLLAMLRNIRAVGAVFFSVLVSLSAAFLLMLELKLTLNLLTMAGLVLLFGLLVDNAVVVIEQLQVQRQRYPEAYHRAVEATLRAVWLPLLGGTLTTLVVLGPLIYFSGDLRALFLPFGILVALVLGFSLLSAVILVPVLGQWLPPSPSPRQLRRLHRLAEAPYRLARRMPRATLLLLILTLGVPLWLLPDTLTPRPEDPPPFQRLATLYNHTIGHPTVQHLRKQWLNPLFGGVLRPFFQQVEFGRGWDFTPRMEVYVGLTLPEGSPIDAADSLIARFERIALQYPGVQQTIAQIHDRQATLRVQFTEEALRTIEPLRVREALIHQATYLAGLDVYVGGLLPQGYYSGVGTGPSEFIVEARGPSYEDLEKLAEAFGRRLLRHPRIVNVDTQVDRYGRRFEREMLYLKWSSRAVQQTGLYPAHLLEAVRPMLFTYFPRFRGNIEGALHLPIRILTAEAERADVYRLLEHPLPIRDTLQIKLGRLSTLQRLRTPPRIERINQQYRRYLAIDYRGPWRLGNRLIKRELKSFATPPGYTLQRRQFVLFTTETQKNYLLALALATLLVFLITASVFESWHLPLVVMLSVPMAGIGLAVAFLWTGVNFAEGAMIGTLLLAGIAVNDSILLVERYRQLRYERPHGRPDVLVLLALRHRLRPMWTTTLTSIAALLPLLLFPDQGDFWLGLAVAVTGGLLASTLLAPLATVAWISWREKTQASIP